MANTEKGSDITVENLGKIILSLGAALAMAPASASTLSPTSAGTLPAGVSEIGGVVLDLVGTNGTRVVSQTAASELFVGFPSFTPIEIGTQTGFDASVTDLLGGGLAEAAVRITLEDGDSAPGDFDDGANFLLLNDIEFGNFSDVETFETDGVGNVLSGPINGFPNDDLNTGFFFSDDASLLDMIFASIIASQEVVFGLRDDVTIGDNFFDFTQGLDASLVDVGTGPVASAPVPPAVNPVPVPAALPLMLSAFGGLALLRRRRSSGRSTSIATAAI